MTCPVCEMKITGLLDALRHLDLYVVLLWLGLMKNVPAVPTGGPWPFYFKF